LEWLNKVTFPNEAKCQDVEYARNLYTKLVRRLLKNGTTTALYFATIHLEASKILADICDSWGQRGYIGKLNADQLSPSYYIEKSLEQSLEDTETFIQYLLTFPSTTHRSAIVHPVITPRFIPTCSYPLLQGLGKLAAKYDVHVQSHAAETVDQVLLVREQYPTLQRDVAIFSSVGLLRPNKTVFAHGVHLHDAEIRTLAEHKVGISACPLSNILYSRGVVPVQRYMRNGLRVGLGTDFGGGPTAGMLTSIRGAILADRTTDFTPIERGEEVSHWPEENESEWNVDFIMGFYLATVIPLLKRLMIGWICNGVGNGKCFWEI
jgi:guanine deaminase